VGEKLDRRLERDVQRFRAVGGQRQTLATPLDAPCRVHLDAVAAGGEGNEAELPVAERERIRRLEDALVRLHDRNVRVVGGERP